jgi:Tfp pilus assembly protein PilE
MRPPSGAAIPRSFVSEAEDVAVVLRARQVRANVARLWRVLGLTVGVGVLGVLGLGMCTPCFVSFRCRSMQSEAKGTLKAFAIAQESFLAEHDRYGDVVEVPFARGHRKQRYRYVLTDLGPRSYTAWAFGVADDVTGDVWKLEAGDFAGPLVSVCQ